MKRILLSAIVASMSLAATSEVLPAPQTTGGMPLMEAIKNRKSSRDMSTTDQVSKQDLSNMLWAAWGITHNGKHTIATALNRQELSVYVVTPEGASLYDPKSNSLESVTKEDVRALVGMQQFAVECPLNIVFVTDTEVQPDTAMQAYAAGAASQNVYLYCAANGLKTVLRASFDGDALQKALNLPANKKILFIQTVGK